MNDTTGLDLTESIISLEWVELELWMIDAEDLNEEEKNELADDLSRVTTNLSKLRAADLDNLADEFKEKLPELKTAAVKLESDLNDLQNASEVIHTVSAAMETITSIVMLLA